MSTYKLDGVRFQTIEDLKESLWCLYKDTLTIEEFEKYVNENVVITE